MVAYLKKPEGSEEFHQIVDFLNTSHIRYALTENPTIYVSHIKQFCQTTTAKTLDNGEIELAATIDGTIKTVTEGSVRRHLQLADADGISSLPTTKIFKQLSLMGYGPVIQGPVVQGKGSTHPIESHHTPISALSTSQPQISPTSRRTTRQEFVVPQPRSLTQTLIADEAASTGVDVRYGGAATTVIGLEAGQGSGNIDKTPTIPQDSPLLRVNTLRRNEGSMTLHELMVFCTTLSKKVESLETDLWHTKDIYGAACTKLIKEVKYLEKIDKSSQARRRARIVVSDNEDDLEDPSKQGRKIAEIDHDPNISLVQYDVETHGRHGHDMEFDFDFNVAKEVFTAKKGVSTAKPVSTAGAAVTTAIVAISTASPIRNTGVSTANDMTMAETLVYIRKSAAKDKGKGKMDESETVKTKTKLQQEQERLDFETAEDIKARVKADEELVQRLQAKEREKYSKAEQARMLAELINQRKSYTLKQMRSYSFDEIKTLFETNMRNVKTFVPIESKDDKAVPKLAARSLKRDAEEELNQESSKRQKTDESSELAEELRDKELKNCHN
ncbi:hypothetical protein Tco_1182445 [Tanacetum coccineum]